jgi:hypothetical protein
VKITRIALFLVVIAVAAAVPAWWYISADWEEFDPDMPAGSSISKDEYLQQRNEYLYTMRGWDTAKQDSRTKAIREMERSEARLASQRSLDGSPAPQNWRPLGPAPIPVGGGNSGRVSSIAVHPTNSSIVYAGTAQGGLYRSLNGGTSWTPMLDNALSLAIGAIAIVPSDPSTIFVGTGEPEFSADSFFGVGLYRIQNADSANPIITGPLNQSTTSADIFTGRAISEIIVNPSDPNTLFVTSTSGIAGLGGSTAGFPLPDAGLYRTTNAMSANPTFSKINITGTLGSSRSAIDALIEPDNPNRLLVAVVGSGGDGGVYLSTDALSATPNFTRTLTTSDGATLGRTELAGNKIGGVMTVFAATGTASGTVFKSVDGGATFPTSVANNFCNPQCFYDIAVAVDPTDASKVYLGGSPTMVFGRSTNGGTSFSTSGATGGLHVDTHVFALAPSDSKLMYFGSDGGIWKTTDVGAPTITWQSLNNSTFSATQFQGISMHPRDRYYLIGGTQDNGTEFLFPDGSSWVRSDGGDGGFTAIDQNSPNINTITAYHTYFNSTGSQIGFARATTTVASGDPNWSTFFGCGGTANGINCADAVLFYAPMVVGPGNPNSLYFGTNRLYRSANQGVTMTDVSGTLPARISAIAVSPQNDDVRLAGLTTGAIFLSTAPGATTMTDVTGPIPARYVGRVAIDPNNANVAYVTLNGFGLAAGQHVWKTTNLLSGTPTWVASGSGIPDVPVNAFAVDPLDSQSVFAGTDIGVFRSLNGGATWQPFSPGLPRVAVFGMEFHKTRRVLRIATHGRGIWEYKLASAAVPADFDGDSRTDLSVFRPSDNTWYAFKSSGGVSISNWGAAGDVLVPGDYDGDNKTDPATYRPSAGQWYILRSSDSTVNVVGFGVAGDIPVAGDYDSDGKTDQAQYRPSTGTWYVFRSSDLSVSITNWGVATDVPVQGDYDGDGKCDVAVFRPSTGVWYAFRSLAGPLVATWGVSGDKPVQADYDGDNKDDLAIFRPADGNWYVYRSSDNGVSIVNWGSSTDVPVPGDYDGDGRDDQAVYRNGSWFVFRSTAGPLVAAWGVAGDVAVPSKYIP